MPSSKSLNLILVLQIAILALAGLSAIGVHIPILRQTVGFAYITFVPGFLILRVANSGESHRELKIVITGLCPNTASTVQNRDAY